MENYRYLNLNYSLLFVTIMNNIVKLKLKITINRQPKNLLYSHASDHGRWTMDDGRWTSDK